MGMFEDKIHDGPKAKSEEVLYGTEKKTSKNRGFHTKSPSVENYRGTTKKFQSLHPELIVQADEIYTSEIQI